MGLDGPAHVTARQSPAQTCTGLAWRESCCEKARSAAQLKQLFLLPPSLPVSSSSDHFMDFIILGTVFIAASVFFFSWTLRRACPPWSFCWASPAGTALQTAFSEAPPSILHDPRLFSSAHPASRHKALLAENGASLTSRSHVLARLLDPTPNSPTSRQFKIIGMTNDE